MQYKEIIKVLNSIEENVPISKIKYNGLKIWPIIRLEIWKTLHSNLKYSSTQEIVNKPSLKKKLKKYWNIVFYQLNKNDYRKSKAVFLIARYDRTVQVDGKYYSRFSNSLQEVLREINIDSVTLDLSRKKQPVYGETYFIDREIPSFYNWIFRRKNINKIKHWENLENYLNKNFPNIKLDKNFIIKNTEAVLNYQKIFERILKKIKPKVCFLECYYHPTAFGYILACRKLGIKTVEIQHGEQHGMYRDWINIPKDGYEIMPNLWWCWGEESARKINEWSKSAYPEHKAFVGGNPWISKFVSNINENNHQENSKNVLIALPNKDFSIQHLLEAIKNSPPNINWQVRLHPMRLQDKTIKEKIQIEFKNTGNKNIEIEEASSLPLFDILLKVDFLITPWSTVAYEALTFGVHPIIISIEDKVVFENYVNKGLFSLADTSEKILSIINKNKSKFNFKEEIPYIETDKEKMKNILSNIIKQ